MRNNFQLVQKEKNFHFSKSIHVFYYVKLLVNLKIKKAQKYQEVTLEKSPQN